MARRQASRPWTDPQSPQYMTLYQRRISLNREKFDFFAPQRKMRKWRRQANYAKRDPSAPPSADGRDHSGEVVESAVCGRSGPR